MKYFLGGRVEQMLSEKIDIESLFGAGGAILIGPLYAVWRNGNVTKKPKRLPLFAANESQYTYIPEKKKKRKQLVREKHLR